MPIRHETAPPPVEEKNGAVCAKASAISRLQMTAPIGWPLPVALATQTMSGTTSSCSKAQKVSPVRPYPTWTSSAMHSAPAARAAA